MPLDPKQQPPYYGPGTTPQRQIRIIKSLVTQYTTAATHKYTEYTVPANTITKSGEGISIELHVNYVTVVGGAQIYVKWNGVALVSAAMSNTGLSKLKFTILYNAATTAITLMESYLPTLVNQYFLATGQDWTIDNTIEIGIVNVSTDTTQALASKIEAIFSQQ